MQRISITEPLRSNRGFVLVTTLLLLAVMIVLGATALMQTSMDSSIAANYRARRQAFYNAEAGLQYVLLKIRQGLDAGNITLPAAAGQGNGTALSLSVPSGFGCTLPSEIELATPGSGRYRVAVTGTAPPNGQCHLEALFNTTQSSLFDFGLFADGVVDLKSMSSIYSYDSTTTPNPTPANSTASGDVGSNTEVKAFNNTYIDGDVGLGADTSGNSAVFTAQGNPGPTVTGTAGISLSRINPDPLGAIGGNLAQQFVAAIVSNDNAAAGIAGTAVTVKNSLTLTGKTGGASYYFTNLTLKNGAVLTIDASSGPVTIYLSGSLEAKNGSTINVTGSPCDLSIFSNSTSGIVLKHNGDTKGLIYAPYASVELKNSAQAYGLIWADSIDFKNSAQFFVDTAVMDRHSGGLHTIQVLSWRDLSN
ncbi:MAG: hypothetical protein JW884_00495 [Deltaproteobacteria bacterium]|nr:hypothetical protein [Deltaproteobacteria bacterium]